MKIWFVINCDLQFNRNLTIFFLFLADCGEPKPILRAVVSVGGTHEGDKRRYTCNQQTVTEGNTEIYCQTDGQWSSTNLYCRRK